MQEVTIEKLVHGGQGLATLPDGKKVFVWNALPAEKVLIRLLKSKKGYAEAIAEEVLDPSPDRIEPVEPESYLATSPWQIMTFAAENVAKKQILNDAFANEKINIPTFDFVAGEQSIGYRTKMEFGFWGDNEGIHVAHFVRGSHGKTRVKGSALAKQAINEAVAAIVAQLNTLAAPKHGIRAGDIKSLIVRCNQSGDAVAALFVKPKNFPKLRLPSCLKGIVVYHSNPKSPASLPTEQLQLEGVRILSDEVYGTTLHYDVLSFFKLTCPGLNRHCKLLQLA